MLIFEIFCYQMHDVEEIWPGDIPNFQIKIVFMTSNNAPTGNSVLINFF